MLKRLLTLFRTNDSNRQAEQQVTRSNQWTWERAHEQPYDHYTNAVEEIKQMKRDRCHGEVEELLQWCIDYTEAEAFAENTIENGPAPAYYRHLGIVYRKDDRYQDEVALLEGYADVCRELRVSPDESLVKRLERARELAADR